MATRQGLSQSAFNLIIDTFHFIPGSISEISIGRNTRSSGSDNDMHALFPPLIVREVSLLLHPPLNLKGIEIIFDRFVSSKKKEKREERKKKKSDINEDSPRLRRDSSEGLFGAQRFPRDHHLPCFCTVGLWLAFLPQRGDHYCDPASVNRLRN